MSRFIGALLLTFGIILIGKEVFEYRPQEFLARLLMGSAVAGIGAMLLVSKERF